MLTLSEAESLYNQALSNWRAFSMRHLALKAFNAHQFREHPDRVTPSIERMDAAVAELRLLAHRKNRI